MNSFDLERKGYYRINNNGGDPLTNFYKYEFYTSFVITSDVGRDLPTVYNTEEIEAANGRLLINANAFSSEVYPDGSRYACYVAVEDVVNSASNTNLPYAKVNVYIGSELPSGNPGTYFMTTQSGDILVTEDNNNIIIQ